MCTKILLCSKIRMASLDFDMIERGVEDEPGLPRLTVNNMIKEILPETKVAKESKDLIINCCSEFIHLVSTEANELAEKSKKAHTEWHLRLVPCNPATSQLLCL